MLIEATPAAALGVHYQGGSHAFGTTTIMFFDSQSCQSASGADDKIRFPFTPTLLTVPPLLWEIIRQEIARGERFMVSG